ncbi:MAG: GDP-L-fucose synthase family protein, partial [Elainellaceae cyanobacterium]
METNAKIYVAGHNGLVGSAIVRALNAQGYHNLLLRSSRELDLTRQAEVEAFFEAEKPEYVFLAAARVGGIQANNTYRGEFIYANLMIEANVIHSAHKSGAKKLLFLGSSCIYPKLCPQPMKEDYLLTDFLEPTNEPYAIAKIAGLKLCENYYRQYGANFISAMPTNLYGVNDNFDLANSHVLPALMRKFHEAKLAGEPTVTVWGTGTPLREFLYVDDLADALVFLMETYNEMAFVNVGTGKE